MKEKGYLFSYSFICVCSPERKRSHTPLYSYQYADNQKKTCNSRLKLSPNAVIYNDQRDGFKIWVNNYERANMFEGQWELTILSLNISRKTNKKSFEKKTFRDCVRLEAFFEKVFFFFFSAELRKGTHFLLMKMWSAR